VSTALGSSRIWATFGFGIVNEIYWPSTGQPQLRDLGFIVKSPQGWTEIKRNQRYIMTTPKPYVPLPRVVHQTEIFRLELEYLPHPLRDSLLIKYALQSQADDLELYLLAAPHLGGEHKDNTAKAGFDLTAERGSSALCIATDGGFERGSAGYVGVSDGWQDFEKNGEMRWAYEEAGAGNVALTAKVPTLSGTIAIAFAGSVDGARTLARSSLADDYEATRNLFVQGWEDWARTLTLPQASQELRRQAYLSATVLKIHEDRTYNGAIVASLSVPWGQSRDDVGGYHLVWTRDAVQAALSLVAVGKSDDAARVLSYLIGTQADDGSWGQNSFPSGRGYWSGNQLDEVVMPLLLAAKLRATGELMLSRPLERMVRRAIAYVVRNGPMTDQDRWEENAGASPFTISLLLVAMVSLADFFGDDEKTYLLSLTDCWNERIESWTYTTAGKFCGQGVPGYFVRLGPVRDLDGNQGKIPVRNRSDDLVVKAADMIGLEFLYLVRTGLRRADDPRIRATVDLVDKVLGVDTPTGLSFYRYNGDGYGEHKDGKPYDGNGIGRLWPLLTGERAHYAIAAGVDPQPYLDAMNRMTGPSGLIPEQVWDDEAIPDRNLFPGKPSGSAMPLVWAHAEFLKLLSAKSSGRPVEMFDAVLERWGRRAPRASTWFWRATSPFDRAPVGRVLRFEADQQFRMSYRIDGGENVTVVAEIGPFDAYAVGVSAECTTNASKLAFTLLLQDGKERRGEILFSP
jgi:glucoamylase